MCVFVCVFACVGGFLATLRLYPESSGGVSLRIYVHDEARKALFFKRCGEIYRRRRFPYTAFLVRDGDYARSREFRHVEGLQS